MSNANTTLDWVAEPISEELPAGADLWGEDDPAFSDYYQDGMGRLPEPDEYAQLGRDIGNGKKTPDVIFDPNSVELNTELGQIDRLLKRTRDIRLLTLRAQWSILAGDIAQTTLSVGAIASLIEAMPEAAHPQTEDGPRDRLDAINDLSAMGAMILPLRYLDIAETGASRRRFMVANGQVTPHVGEDDLTIDGLTQNMAAEKEAVAETHAELVAFNANLERIELACLSNPKPHTPQFTTLKQEIQEVLKVIAEADPKLSASIETSDGKASDSAEDLANGASVARPATEVRSQDEARQRLVAVETYFGRHEPSSAAVLLVTQARQLIGKSLVDAFDILMPNSAERAKVDFISDNGFQLAHPRLRQLANEVLIEDETAPTAQDVQVNPVREVMQEHEADSDHDENANAEAPQAQPVEDVPVPAAVVDEAPAAKPSPFKVQSAGEASSQILAVETYFRAVEKSSPVPMLLGRARSYIGKDFETILKEMVPRID